MLQNPHCQVLLFRGCNGKAFPLFSQCLQQLYHAGEHAVFKQPNRCIAFAEDGNGFFRHFLRHAEFLRKGLHQRRPYDKMQLLRRPDALSHFFLHILRGTDDAFLRIGQCAVQIEEDDALLQCIHINFSLFFAL